MRFACKDAADANNDEFIDLADPIFTLYHQYVGGIPPPSPFPNPGPDPKEIIYRLGCEDPSFQ